MASSITTTLRIVDETTVYLIMARDSRPSAAANPNRAADYKSNARLWLTLARRARLDGRRA